ncbi:uncharacterized protein LOC115382819 [Salarias fasciatus]|uniref:uncharacterized protein LOC115382819 n=1 Tax=Salarias fasciatus TaxID=181472 RepID=UPI0011767AE0|nr:uncharacterized protein LOC115382819 [Salarias fasciatus]
MAASNRGQTWGSSETSVFLDIWAEHFSGVQLSTKHKNTHVYGGFRKALAERGFRRTVQQCRTKAKKLRAQYIKVRDALKTSGGSSEERQKFIWYDRMHAILRGTPAADPADLLESRVLEQSVPGAAVDVAEDCATDTKATSSRSGPADAESSSTGSLGPAQTGLTDPLPFRDAATSRRLPIPGAEAHRINNSQDFQQFVDTTEVLLEKMDASDDWRTALEDARFERLLREREEKCDRRLDTIMDNQQTCMEMLKTILSTLPGQSRCGAAVGVQGEEQGGENTALRGVGGPTQMEVNHGFTGRGANSVLDSSVGDTSSGGNQIALNVIVKAFAETMLLRAKAAVYEVLMGCLTRGEIQFHQYDDLKRSIGKSLDDIEIDFCSVKKEILEQYDVTYQK